MFNEIDLLFYNGVYVFLRCFGFFLIAPIFSLFLVPKLTRLILTLSISFFIIKAYPQYNYKIDLIIMIKEMFLGMLLGFIIKIGFDIFNFIGDIIGFQSGMNMNLMLDPLGANTNIYSSVFLIIGLVIFFIINGHIYVINMLYKSFEFFPSDKFINLNSLKLIIMFVNDLFIFGIKFAFPVIMVLLITEIVIGVFSKILPGINFLIIGQPLRCLVSIISVFIFISFFMDISGNVFEIIFNRLNSFLMSL